MEYVTLRMVFTIWNHNLVYNCCCGDNGRHTMEESSAGHVIYPAEAEAFIRELVPLKISDIGSDRWSRQRERLEQLTLQAVYNVSQQADEFVKEFLVDLDKLGVVVHELVCVELWREHVFPVMIKSTACPTSGFPSYLVLYTEGTLVSLLETSLFYQECCEHVQDYAVDVVDYCHRQLVALLAEAEEREEKEHGQRSMVEEEEEEEGSDEEGEEKKKIVQELQQQSAVIRFSVGMKALSILHYLTNHLAVLPIGVSTRLLNTHDLPCLLVHVLELKPWLREKKEGGSMEYYEDGRWMDVEDRTKLTKSEGQVWLTLYQILLDKDCQQKYEVTHHSKTMLLTLRKYFSAPLLEQLPHLTHLQRYLEHLSIMDPPPAKKDFIIQQVPVIYDKLQNSNAKKWQSIAKQHSKILMEPTPAQLQETAKRWTAASNLDILEDLVAGPPKCAVCGGVATKHCSRCRNEWYCGRQCQVSQWKKHKPACDVIASTKRTK